MSCHVKRGALLLAAALIPVLVACRHDGRDLGEPTANGTQPIVPETTVEDTEAIVDDFDTLPGEDLEGDTSGSIEVDDSMSVALPFSQGEPIPEEYTCNGEDMSFPVDWFSLPEGTVEVAIEVSDVQAPDFVHWIIAGLDPAIGYIDEGQVPVGAIQATNGNGDVGYTGPCPPPGETHTYLVTLSALDQQIELPDGVDAETLQTAIGASTIESVVESGTYTS